MITSTMNLEELCSHYTKDMATIRGKLEYLRNRFMDLVDKNPPKSKFAIFNELECKASRQTYYSYMVKTQEQKLHRFDFAKVLMPNGGYRYYHIQVSDYDRWVIEYTSHFFERYQQRMGIPGDIKHVIKSYTRNNNPNMVRIYQGEYKGQEAAVYMINDGIAMALPDDKRHVVVLLTFIPYDMLKESQMLAYNKLKAIKQNQYDLVYRGRDIGLGDKDTGIMVESANREMIDEAFLLYSAFFNEDEVPLGKSEVLYIDPDFAELLERFKV